MVTAIRLTWLLQIFLLAGCAASGPTVKDYQVITQALQVDARQAQRTITELEMQQQALQHDLGEARTAKARLEGDLLDAERRLLEARHIVDLQRGELALAAEKREGLVQSSREVQAQMQAKSTEVDRLRQQMIDEQSERLRLQTMDEAFARQANEMAELKAAVRESLRGPGLKKSRLNPAASRPSALLTPVAVDDQPAQLSRMVRVRRGDSLWALARSYGVSLDELITVNRLTTDLIIPGQKLLIPSPAP